MIKYKKYNYPENLNINSVFKEYNNEVNKEINQIFKDYKDLAIKGFLGMEILLFINIFLITTIIYFTYRFWNWIFKKETLVKFLCIFEIFLGNEIIWSGRNNDNLFIIIVGILIIILAIFVIFESGREYKQIKNIKKMFKRF